ncbi:MAG: methylglyoxal synthase [Acholeplasmataceae bacterium]|jgi:methylglyoxal synthase
MNIALIAHDDKKKEMISLVSTYQSLLSNHTLYATKTTGTLIKEKVGLDINILLSGPLGGDQQIGALVAEDKIDIVIFLRDPLTAQPHEPDVSALLRICDVHNKPLATNLKSATIMLNTLSNK